MLSRFVVSQVKNNSYFLVGLLIGLWVALTAIPLDDLPEPCESITAAPISDEYEPHREEKPLGSAGQNGGRSVQRPRYYSTELGMRSSLLVGILSSEQMLSTRVAALNKTSSRLQPGLRFFITASALQAAPGLANVVGFTDTREMLKPFHALKYLADNYLEEYNFFFLASDTTFVNSQRLKELVSRLSVSQDVYMGAVADDDSHYCSLDGGILLSNSVLRAVHSELDWCVRNSYSARHHENLGRCVLHAAHTPCASHTQGEDYSSIHLGEGELKLTPALADAVTATSVVETAQYYQLHAYVSRVFLERSLRAIDSLRREIAGTWGTWGSNVVGGEKGAGSDAGVGVKGAGEAGSWPRGLRDDMGVVVSKPKDRFDHLRWTSFNATHAFLPNDLHSVLPITGAHKDALQLVVSSCREWAMARARWASAATMLEGARLYSPASDMRYRILFALAGDSGRQSSILVEAVRPLGAARLVPVPYVTESARAHIVLPVVRPAPSAPSPAHSGPAPVSASPALGFLQRYAATSLKNNGNTALYVVLVNTPNSNTSEFDAIRSKVSALSLAHRDATIDLTETAIGAGPADETDTELEDRAGRAAVDAVARKISKDALVILGVPYMEYNDEFLNRARMNVICGLQWYSPVGFSRYALYEHPAGGAGGARRGTGKFTRGQHRVSAFCLKDYLAAAPLSPVSPLPSLLSLHTPCVRSPEPALVFPPRPPPPARRPPPPRALPLLEFGPRHALATLLLQTQADVL